MKYTGFDTHEKYAKIVEHLEKSVDCLLVTSLDEIAWLLNLRGTDIEFNPVFFSYIIFYTCDKSVDLFIDSAHLNA